MLDEIDNISWHPKQRDVSIDSLPSLPEAEVEYAYEKPQYDSESDSDFSYNSFDLRTLLKQVPASQNNLHTGAFNLEIENCFDDDTQSFDSGSNRLVI